MRCSMLVLAKFLVCETVSLGSRSLSTTRLIRADRNSDRRRRTKAPALSNIMRSNPLVGGISLVSESSAAEQPPLMITRNNEEPAASASSNNSTQKASSPPAIAHLTPPAPSPLQDSRLGPLSPFGEAAVTAIRGQTHTYDASSPTYSDLAAIIGSKAESYASSLSVSTSPQLRPTPRTKAPTGRTIFVTDRFLGALPEVPLLGGSRVPEQVPAAMRGAGSARSPLAAAQATLAFKLLNGVVSKTKVKEKARTQRFHERKGLKRKRLRSQRWRAKFKAGFQATLERVLELKGQGW